MRNSQMALNIKDLSGNSGHKFKKINKRRNFQQKNTLPPRTANALETEMPMKCTM